MAACILTKLILGQVAAIWLVMSRGFVMVVPLRTIRAFHIDLTLFNMRSVLC